MLIVILPLFIDLMHYNNLCIIQLINSLKTQIDKYMAQEDDDEYVPFILEDYVSNPVALARINAGVTQKELAKLLKVTQAYISKLESSKRISAKAMLRVNKVLENNS